MLPRKLKIGFARFPYAGNGGTEAEHPAIADWLVATVLKIVKDDRCEKDIYRFRRADTPIPMVRNRALLEARQHGVDVLVMVDSDQVPDLMVPAGGKPFWDTSFDFLYRRWERGPCVIAAPYCGPPPHPLYGGEENVYMFRWAYNANDPSYRGTRLAAFSREEAAGRVGMEEVAAAPTGLMMVDMRLLDVVPKPWFDYEWEDPPYNSQKASTEDVYFTRNCTLSGVPVFANWDAWAGHVKPLVVGKPILPTADTIRHDFAKAQEESARRWGQVVEWNAGRSTEEVLRSIGLVPSSGNGRFDVSAEEILAYE